MAYGLDGLYCLKKGYSQIYNEGVGESLLENSVFEVKFANERYPPFASYIKKYFGKWNPKVGKKENILRI